MLTGVDLISECVAPCICSEHKIKVKNAVEIRALRRFASPTLTGLQIKVVIIGQDKSPAGTPKVPTVPENFNGFSDDSTLAGVKKKHHF